MLMNTLAFSGGSTSNKIGARAVQDCMMLYVHRKRPGLVWIRVCAGYGLARLQSPCLGVWAALYFDKGIRAPCRSAAFNLCSGILGYSACWCSYSMHMVTAGRGCSATCWSCCPG
jgi:hypothetical protein